MLIIQLIGFSFKKKSADLLTIKNQDSSPNKIKSTEKSLPVLKPGDMVRVRSVDEIKSTLDSEGKYNGGITFIDEMAQFCGGTYRVFKRVKKVFDSYEWKMKKSHEMVLLEGVFCHGYGPYKDCDRTCFFFWKDAWLEKVE